MDAAERDAWRKQLWRGRGRGPGIDKATCILALLWVGVWLFLPDKPLLQEMLPPLPAREVVAWDVPLANVPLYLRPDLMAISSEVAFGTDVIAENPLAGIPVYDRRIEQPLSLAQAEMPWREPGVASAILQEQLQRSMDPAWWPADTLEVEGSASVKDRRPSVNVVFSPAFDGAGFNAAAAVLDQLPATQGAWEAELWLAFDASGRPQHVFLEQGSGIPAVDQALARVLWHPDLWREARGAGWIKVNYVPRTGAEHED